MAILLLRFRSGFQVVSRTLPAIEASLKTGDARRYHSSVRIAIMELDFYSSAFLKIGNKGKLTGKLVLQSSSQPK
ncbi:MAG: hypothetical protein GY801_32395 [bacterium]|nr:hypothetical protein [bacterium]